VLQILVVAVNKYLGFRVWCVKLVLEHIKLVTGKLLEFVELVLEHLKLLLGSLQLLATLLRPLACNIAPRQLCRNFSGTQTFQ
jgi:hypothetical protein